MAAVTRSRSLLRSENGAELVEFALVFPILLVVMLGIIDFGFLFQRYEVLTNAAREGARVAVLPTAVDGAVDARVREYLAIGGLRTADDVLVNVTPATVSLGAAGTATASQVVVTYPYSFMVLQPVAQLVVKDSTAGEAFEMVATTVMRNE